MELKIYNQEGVLKANVSPSDNSTQQQQLMGDHVLNLSFTLPEYVNFSVNDYIDLNGERYTLLDNYEPSHKNDQEYAYSPKFYGITGELKKALMVNLTDGAFDTSFSLYGTPGEHLAKIVDNINRIKGTTLWSAGTVVDGGSRNVEYKNKFCIEALNDLAKAYDTEWWVEGTTIHLCRCEHGLPVELGYRHGLTDLAKSENSGDVKFVTRLIPVGSARNIDKTKYGFSRLQLPDRSKYVERNTGYGISEQVEEAAFADIYPKRTGTVGAVRSEDKTNEEGNAFTVYYFTDPGLTFDPNEYNIGGLVKHVVFQSGDLNGNDFEVNFNSGTKEFEIINQYSADGVQLPGSHLIPREGDKYLLYNLSMPQEYYAEAEKQFKEAVDNLLIRQSEDPSVYKANTDYVYIEKNNISLTLGRRVKLTGDKYFGTGGYRNSRITSLTRKINNPSQVYIECSSAVGKGRADRLESDLSDMKTIVAEQLDREPLAILRTWDRTELTDFNVLSSLRTLSEIKNRSLSRQQDDTASGHIIFEKGGTFRAPAPRRSRKSAVTKNTMGGGHSSALGNNRSSGTPESGDYSSVLKDGHSSALGNNRSSGAPESEELPDFTSALVEEAYDPDFLTGTVTEESNFPDMLAGGIIEEDFSRVETVMTIGSLDNVKETADWAEDGMVLVMRNGMYVPKKIQAGSGTGGIVMKLRAIGATALAGVPGSKVEIGYSFTSVYEDDGTETGGGTAVYKINSLTVATVAIAQGDHHFDVSPYLVTGINKISVEATDSAGSARSLTYTVELVDLSLTSTFDDAQVFAGDIPYKYTPVGAVSKTVHFVVDGGEAGTAVVAASNRLQTYSIPKRTHGSHTLEVYMTAVVNNVGIRSNSLFYDLLCIEEGKTDPVIASSFRLSAAGQYETVSIPFMVYNPLLSTAEVTLSVDGAEVAVQTVDRTRQVWTYRLDRAGVTEFRISSGTAVKTFRVTVSDSPVVAVPETQGLELYLTSANRSNNDHTKEVWEYNSIRASLEGFNFKTDGWLPGNDGSVALRVAGNARVVIPFKLFGKDFRSGGKTIEFEFETRDVTDYDAVVIDCMEGGTDSAADRIDNAANRIDFTESENNRQGNGTASAENKAGETAKGFSYMEARSDSAANGIGLRITAQKAFFASEQTRIETQFKEEERVRVSFSVEERAENRLVYTFINGILSGVAQYPAEDNFVQRTPLDIRIGSNDCTVDLYNIRIYDHNLTQYQLLDNYIGDIDNFNRKLEVAERNLIFNDYGDILYAAVLERLPCMIITGELPAYKGDKKTVAVTYADREHPDRSFTSENVQIDVQGTSSQYYPRKNYKTKHKGGFLMTASGVKADKYALREGSIAVDTFCQKADFAESSGTHNTGMAKLVHELAAKLGLATPPQKSDPRVRTTVDGFPIAVFHRPSDDGKLEFVGKYNFNNDKSTQETFGFEGAAECWEVCNNTSARTLFKVSDYATPDWLNDFEGRYPDGNEDYTHLKELTDWIVSTDGKPEKFAREAMQHFNKDFLLFYYLLTEVYAMVDQRAKNMMLASWGNEGSGAYKWYPVFYDNDTVCGINNEGAVAFSYDVEYHDTIGTQNVFNGEKSVLWNNVEQAFAEEIAALYYRMRSNGFLSYETSLEMFNTRQSGKWCEALYNMDSKYKYIDPLVEDGNGSYLYAAQGSRKEHRTWWLYNRFRYMDSKYAAGDFLSDYATLRLYTPADYAGVEPDAGFRIVPFADQYVRVKFGSYVVSKCTRKGELTAIEAPDIEFNDTETIIYGASRLKSLGDLSGKYAGTVDVSKAVRLAELLIGSGAEGYRNTNLTVLSIGSNRMLRTLDIRNCPNLRQAVDLSGCSNIERVYAQGTSVTAVILPDAGILSQLHLPATVTNLTLKNQPALRDGGFSVAGVDKLTTLRLENMNRLNVFALVDRCLALPVPVLSRVRLLNVQGSSRGLDTLFRLTRIAGMDEHGNNVPTAVVTGRYDAGRAVYADQLPAVQKAFPELEVLYEISAVPFEDKEAERVCLEKYDKDKDGYLSTEEAAAVASIGQIFKGNTQLVSLNELPYFKGLSALVANACEGCTNLRSVTLPTHTAFTSVMENAFKDCTSLDNVVVPANVKEIRSAAFYLCSSLRNLVLPPFCELGRQSIQSIAITSLKVPYGTTLSECAIRNHELKYLEFPETVTVFTTNSIRDNGMNVEGGATLVLPSSLGEFQYLSLSYCYFKRIYLKAVVPPARHSSLFYFGNYSEGDILWYIPKGTLKAYQSALNWDRANFVEFDYEKEEIFIPE